MRGGDCMTDEQIVKALKMLDDALALIKRQQAEKERLEIELQTMRIAANSYKSRVQTLEMDNAQLHSDIVNANQNFDHINGLWEAEKEKVEKAKQKVINIRKELQKAKAEIEELKFPYKMQVEVSKEIENEIKSEAVREFAERLKETNLYEFIEEYFDNAELCYEVRSDLFNDFVDNLVMEMTEKEGGKG
jgi:uncharacterized coiled-coil DUF342 family protein